MWIACKPTLFPEDVKKLSCLLANNPQISSGNSGICNLTFEKKKNNNNILNSEGRLQKKMVSTERS